MYLLCSLLYTYSSYLHGLFWARNLWSHMVYSIHAMCVHSSELVAYIYCNIKGYYITTFLQKFCFSTLQKLLFHFVAFKTIHTWIWLYSNKPVDLYFVYHHIAFINLNAKRHKLVYVPCKQQLDQNIFRINIYTFAFSRQ